MSKKKATWPRPADIPKTILMEPEPLSRRRIIVVAVDGKTAPADCAACPQCGHDNFVLFWVRSKDLHVQCVKCGTIYCNHKGPCRP